MKRLTLFLFSLNFLLFYSYAIRDSLRPVQYSALGGRMLHAPVLSPRAQASLIRKPAENNLLEEQEVNAAERNRRIRLWQLQRAKRRPYGSYAYHRGSAAEPPIGVTPSTMAY